MSPSALPSPQPVRTPRREGRFRFSCKGPLLENSTYSENNVFSKSVRAYSLRPPQVVTADNRMIYFTRIEPFIILKQTHIT